MVSKNPASHQQIKAHSSANVRAMGDIQANPRPQKAVHMTDRHLSGYPQRFVTQLNGAITQCVSEQTSGALMAVSIQNLPMIMNAYGAQASEQVMRHVETAIVEVVGEQDVIYRIQRDQFGVIIQNRQQDELLYLTKRLQSHIQQCCEENDFGSIHVLSTIASVKIPEEAKHAEEALGKVFMATHDHELAHEPMRFYRERNEEAAFSRQEMGLANYLTEALRDGRLLMAYQPIVCSKTGEVRHYEALLRIRSDDGKIGSAGALIPIAERMGLIGEVDEFTLKSAVKELRESDNLHLALNVSNLTTKSTKWLQMFAQMMQETPEIAPRLTVEITETAAQMDLHQTAYFVAEVQSHGCLVALDDFGSGYTSFRQLKTLSVDIVKIDGMFVKDLVDNADNRFFVKTLLDFTQGFGLKSVAEFVENGEIAKMLMELGVDMLQGYYLGRPETERLWLK